jgi:hypothetical protein
MQCSFPLDATPKAGLPGQDTLLKFNAEDNELSEKEPFLQENQLIPGCARVNRVDPVFYEPYLCSVAGAGREMLWQTAAAMLVEAGFVALVQRFVGIVSDFINKT